VARAAAGGGGVEARTFGDGGRVATAFGGDVREVAVAGLDRVCGGDSANERGKIQEDRVAAAV